MSDIRWGVAGGMIGVLVALTMVWWLGAVISWDLAWPALLSAWTGPDRFMLFVFLVALPCALGCVIGIGAACELHKISLKGDE